MPKMVKVKPKQEFLGQYHRRLGKLLDREYYVTEKEADAPGSPWERVKKEKKNGART